MNRKDIAKYLGLDSWGAVKAELPAPITLSEIEEKLSRIAGADFVSDLALDIFWELGED